MADAATLSLTTEITHAGTTLNFIMDLIELKERIGRSMRAMKKEPKALVFIDGNTDWTFDLPEICGVPVLHGMALTCHTWGCEPEDCPFVPVGATDAEITYRDRRAFAESWSA
jgi:hypothetical protein